MSNYNWRQLFSKSPELTFAVAGGLEARWLAPFAALLIWRDVKELIEVPITKEDAAALEAMWQNRNRENRISKSLALKVIDETFSKYQFSLLDEQRKEEVFNCLERLECIEIESDSIWLREWVKKRI